MKRRDFLNIGAKGALGAMTIGMVACGSDAQETADAIQNDSSLPEINWQMATSWPVSIDTIFGGAEVFAERVAAMTGGKFNIEPRAAGELAPGLEVLDVVQQGAVPCGHTASYYYVGKSNATAFGTSLPFGLNAQQQNAWLYEGGGLELMQAFYARRFNIIQFPAGNTGAQMGGWFRREINTPSDLEGLKVRIPGLGGQVMSRLGATVQVLPGGEIFQALQTGAIDAAEWVGPYDDEKLGLNDAAEFYYYPGWWEPGPTLEVQINLDEWGKLPLEYQEIVKTAAFQANMIMLARYDTRNREALQRMVANGTKLRRYSDEILAAAETAAFELYDEFAEADEDFKEIFTPWKEFRDQVYAWNALNEGGFSSYVYRDLGE